MILCIESFCLSILLLGSAAPAVAQAAIQATTLDDVNLRTGPGPDYPIIVILPAGQQVSVEGRNSTADWVKIRAAQAGKGWVAAALLAFPNSFAITILPIKDSSNVQTTSAPTATVSNTPTVLSGDLSIYAAQITPPVRSAMKAVFGKGQSLGNNSKVFTRVGDCLSGGGWFFYQFGDGQPNDLGPYGYLQDAIDYFSLPPRSGVRNSFVLVSQSEHGGFTSAAVQDPIWSDPHYCRQGETPLACEYRLDKPAIAIIMFGVVDVQTSLTVSAFRSNLNQIVTQSLNDGIVPILSTAPETPAYLARAQQFNQVVLALAADRSLPVINLAQALSAFPDKGLDPDGIHLTPALKFKRVAFSSMKDGFTVWNLLALQSLYNVWQQIIVN